MKARPIEGTDPAAPLAENAALIIKVRLGELLAFIPRALDDDAITEQHDMRIAAKRLRYVLEATEFCFGRPGVVARKRAKDLQGVLGEMHDVDVMLPRLHEHRGELRNKDIEAVLAQAGGAEDLDPVLAGRAPNRTTYRGLEVLEVYLLGRRRILFESFCEFWTETERKSVWGRLGRAADEVIEAGERRREAELRAARLREELEAAEQARREAAERASRAAEELAEAEGAAGIANPESEGEEE